MYKIVIGKDMAPQNKNTSHINTTPQKFCISGNNDFQSQALRAPQIIGGNELIKKEQVSRVVKSTRSKDMQKCLAI